MDVRAIANRPGRRGPVWPSRHAPSGPRARGTFWMRHEARTWPAPRKTLPLFAFALAAQVQLADQGGVALAIDLGQVVKKATTLRDHLEQAAARVVVLLVGLEVFGEVGDAFREDRDLDLGRTGVASGAGVVGDDFVLTISSNRHRVSPIGG